ncbi:UTRA domain-containing protein [Microbispora sp. NPDC049125]|uniref:UTRA domain-containing protein n=1 Tax=Microbispora sp. NPDC049125 TaxID=3154929 RepID=UPI003467BF91
MGRRRPRVRRTADRYQWEKDRALLPEGERRRTGATEHDTGLAKDDLAFDIDYVTERAGAELAGRFGVPEGTRLLHRRYRTSPGESEEPLSLIDSWLVYDLVASNPDLLTPENEPWPGGTQHQLSTVGIEVDRVVDEVSGRPAEPGEARILGLSPGRPVLVLRKTSIDTTGRVVEVAEVTLPGDRAEVVSTTELRRWPHPPE